ncbi:hypothetical protein L228DRAFT_164372 [Xylona heveae TC161]|uniref:Uncharacterized protein n=1 Tax=Xylona heveae (strain CBS 132557 / TC161) TaxID=1328760 RepID=A0A165FHL5_XYLHT|nr:hypothetical protein L228DRAFT_164372 [Xylona heveae TC161]KZF20988.1 hypothetical protein L228DRAFT_164372 [Xylona heveae TC161]
MLKGTRAMGVAYKGISLESLGKEAGPGFSKTVSAAGTTIESKYPNVVEARIQGTKPHFSSKDRSEDKEVVTIGYHTEKLEQDIYRFMHTMTAPGTNFFRVQADLLPHLHQRKILRQIPSLRQSE